MFLIDQQTDLLEQTSSVLGLLSQIKLQSTTKTKLGHLTSPNIHKLELAPI